MKKGRIQGFLAGFLAACVLLIGIPVLAENISVIFNPINIARNGEKVVNAGEDYTREDGVKVPYTVVYNGTTNMSLKAFAELMGIEATFDPDTNTLNLTDPVVAYDPSGEFDPALPTPTPKVYPEIPDERGPENPTIDYVTREELARFFVQALGLTYNGETCSFTDVPTTSEYYNDIALISTIGIMNVADIQKFRPNSLVFRREYANIIMRSSNIRFIDYPSCSVETVKDAAQYGAYVQKEITAALDLGILKLYDDGTIRFEKPLVFDSTVNTDINSIK